MRAATNLKRSLLPITVPLAALLALGMGTFLPQNLFLWDSLNTSMPAQPDPRVVVVGIDDQTLSDYGRLGDWNRSLYARAIDTLQTAGAKAIGVDILLDTPASGDSELSQLISGHQNIVLATSLEQPQGAERWNTSSGISGLNLMPSIIGSKTSYFQTAYEQSGQLYPTISAQLAQQMGQTVELNTKLRLLRSPAQPIPVVPFRDLLSGNTRFSELQNKVVLIGVTASGIAGNTLIDSAFKPVPGVVMQARALSSLFQQPYVPLDHRLTLLLCLVMGILTVCLRGYWGFALAALMLLLGIASFKAHILMPAVTLSLVAVLCSLLVVAERYWLTYQLQRVDPLTGLGSRLAFTRAVELRWSARDTRPLGLLLLDIKEFQQVNERYGRQAGNQLLKQLALNLRSNRSRRELVFRWGADEFALLLEGAAASELDTLAQELQSKLATLHYRELPLQVTIGKSLSHGLENPSELIERASRDRYRTKFADEG